MHGVVPVLLGTRSRCLRNSSKSGEMGNLSCWLPFCITLRVGLDSWKEATLMSWPNFVNLLLGPVWRLPLDVPMA